MTSITSTSTQSFPTEPRTVQVTEGPNAVSITEDENGEVAIGGLDLLLDTGKRQALSAALSVWKYGIVPVEA
jgi:hypothetical protein